MTKSVENSRTVHLYLSCMTPPPAPADRTEIELGLQDRHEKITLGHLQPDGSLQYEVDIVAFQQAETARVRWRGPYVHGKPAAPFLYLSMRSHSDQPTGWIKRLKIPLPELLWDQFAATQAPLCLAASISGNGSGTVPLLGNGWTIQESPYTSTIPD